MRKLMTLGLDGAIRDAFAILVDGGVVALYGEQFCSPMSALAGRRDGVWASGEATVPVSPPVVVASAPPYRTGSGPDTDTRGLSSSSVAVSTASATRFSVSATIWTYCRASS